MSTAQEPFLRSGEALDLAFAFADQTLGPDEILRAAISSAVTAKNFNRLRKLPNGRAPTYVGELLSQLDSVWTKIERGSSFTTREAEIAAIMCALRWATRNDPLEGVVVLTLDRIARSKVSPRLAAISMRLLDMDLDQ